jgi:hypothetical protein
MLNCTRLNIGHCDPALFDSRPSYFDLKKLKVLVPNKGLDKRTGGCDLRDSGKKYEVIGCTTLFSFSPNKLLISANYDKSN